jgi:hypothetical protein
MIAVLCYAATKINLREVGNQGVGKYEQATRI